MWLPFPFRLQLFQPQNRYRLESQDRRMAGTYASVGNMITDNSSTVPTKDQVLIPESQLKKRKTQEKTQADKDQALAEKKKVSSPSWRRKTEVILYFVDDNHVQRETDESLDYEV